MKKQILITLFLTIAMTSAHAEDKQNSAEPNLNNHEVSPANDGYKKDIQKQNMTKSEEVEKKQNPHEVLNTKFLSRRPYMPIKYD